MEQKPKAEDGALHPGEWYWLTQDGGITLLASCQHRPVVLGDIQARYRGGVLAVRDCGGRLVPMTAEHPIAKAIAAIPKMIDLLKRIRDQSETENAEVIVSVLRDAGYEL